MTTLLNDRARLKLAVSEKRHEYVDPRYEEWELSDWERSRRRNDELARQYVENGTDPDVLADLVGLARSDVRRMLRRRGLLPSNPRLLRFYPQSDCHAGTLKVPAAIGCHLNRDARFTCELVEDGILYRRADKGRAA